MLNGYAPIKRSKCETFAISANILRRKNIVYLISFLKKCDWELPGGPVVRTLSFHCQGLGFNPWLGN